MKAMFSTSNDGTCATCRHWTNVAGDSEFPLRAYPPGGGFCALTEAYGGESKRGNSLATAVDYEGFIAVLATRPDFGCVQWTRRVP